MKLANHYFDRRHSFFQTVNGLVFRSASEDTFGSVGGIDGLFYKMKQISQWRLLIRVLQN